MPYFTAVLLNVMADKLNVVVSLFIYFIHYKVSQFVNYLWRDFGNAVDVVLGGHLITFKVSTISLVPFISSPFIGVDGP